MQQDEYLEFLTAATHRSVCLEMSGDYLLLAEQWPEERGRPEPTSPIPCTLTVLAQVLRDQGIGHEAVPKVAAHIDATIAKQNPLIVALEELDAIHAEGENKATLYQCKGAKLPTFEESVAWNEKAVAFAKREVFAEHISTQDWAAFKADWKFADCQRIARVLHEHGYLQDVNDTKAAHFKYIWGRSRRLGELIAKIKRLPADENKTPIESLTDFLLEVHSLLGVFANLMRTLPVAEEHDLLDRIRLSLRKIAPDYVPRLNEIIENPPPRDLDFSTDFTDDDKEEWSRTRREHCDRLHAIGEYLSRIISDLRSKLPS